MSSRVPGMLWAAVAVLTTANVSAEVVLTPPQGYDVGSFATGAGLGDLDGDGRPDLATADSSDATITVRLNVADGVFGPALTLPSPGESPRDVEILDVTGDDLPDLAVAFRGAGADLAVYPGRGDGTFDAPLLYPGNMGSGSFAFSMDAADLDLDGDDDLVIATAVVGDAVALVYRNDGNQGFTATGTFLIATDQIIYVADLALGDVDGDGFPDAIGAADNPGEVALLRGLGDATFGPPEPLPVGAMFPVAVAVGNLNDDQHLDIAVIDGSLGPDHLLVALNDGSGAFALSDDASNGGSLGHSFTTPAALALRDLDGDGIDEAIAQGVVAAGLGDGLLGPLMSYGVNDTVLAVATANLDGDCDDDIVALELSTTFESSAQVIVNASPRPGDFDGDGIVGTTDLLALLAQWGPCADCIEDVDGDGAVGTTDLLALLAAWGSCS